MRTRQINEQIMKSTAQASLMVFTLLVAMCFQGFSQPTAAIPAQGKVFTDANSIRNLAAAEAARQHPVKIRGVVTFHDEALFSRFVQDDTAGIYFGEMTNMPPLAAGQVIEIEGVTGAGEYVSVVLPTSVKVIGTGKLPEKPAVSLEQLVSGQQDSQWVEFSGLVRAVRFEKESGYHQIDFVKGGERFTAYSKELPTGDAQDLVDSVVKVRGVCSTMFNHQRQILGIRVLVPKAAGLTIEKPARPNPFAMTANPIGTLLQFTPGGSFDSRVKVAGTVIHHKPGIAVFVQDDKSGLFCQTMQRDDLQPGDKVEVLGFPAKGEYTPMLEDAVIRKVGTGAEPQPDLVDINKILTGVHDSRLVKLPAKVLERVQRGVNQFLLLQSGDFIFQAYLPQKLNSEEMAAVKSGADVMVTGVCLIERGNNWQAGARWRAAAFHLLLRSANDVVVTNSPVAVAAPDGVWVAVAFGLAALAALIWVIVLKRKIRQGAKQ
jgi:hypothetical protein